MLKAVTFHSGGSYAPPVHNFPLLRREDEDPEFGGAVTEAGKALESWGRAEEFYDKRIPNCAVLSRGEFDFPPEVKEDESCVKTFNIFTKAQTVCGVNIHDSFYMDEEDNWLVENIRCVCGVYEEANTTGMEDMLNCIDTTCDASQDKAGLSTAKTYTQQLFRNHVEKCKALLVEVEKLEKGGSNDPPAQGGSNTSTRPPPPTNTGTRTVDTPANNTNLIPSGGVTFSPQPTSAGIKTGAGGKKLFVLGGLAVMYLGFAM